MNDRIWVLGAPDPEMEQIEGLLRQCGEKIIYATDESGRRVHPGNAYRCPVPAAPEGSTVYAVECIEILPDGWVRIDHHRPRDPGYAKPPAWFFEASSIGQVLTELAWLGQLPDWPEAAWPYRLYGRPRVGIHEIRWSAEGVPRYVVCVAGNKTREVYFGQTLSGDERSARDVYTREPVVSRICEIPEEYLLAAAADHCLAAAYRGECPGVDPDALMRWRVEQRAAHQGRSVEEVLSDVERAREALMDAPVVRLSPEPWEPACGVHGRTGACWQSGGPDPSVRTDACYAMGDPLLAVDMRERVVPELPEAAAREGVCFLARLPGPDGRTKIVCQAGSPEQIRAFMTAWAPAQGLVDIYGDPARGFAGGYLAT